MRNIEDQATDEQERRRARRVLGCFSVVGAGAMVALIVAISAVVLSPIAACACATPLDLVVQNYSHEDAAVAWSQPGVFGTPVRGVSGGAVATRCKTLSAGLRSGIVEVSVTTRGETRTFSVHVRDGLADVPATIVIGADGHTADPIYAIPPAGLRQDESLC